MSNPEITSQIEGLEFQKDAANKAIAFAARVETLLRNNDFKEVILEGYCVKEAARFLTVSTDINISAENRADALANAQAAGYLKRWLHTTQLMAQQLVDDIYQIDQQLEELRAMDADEE